MPKTLKAVFTTIIAGLFLFACEDVSGVLNVEQAITLNGNKEKNTFAPGAYDANINIGRKRIAIEFDEDGSANSKYRFYYPDDFELPTEDGETAFLSSYESRQPYDLFIIMNSEKIYSDLKSGYESCTYTRYVHRCYPRTYPGYPGHGCRMDEETILGQRYAEFYEVTEDIKYTVALSNPGQNDQLADFLGGDLKYTKDYVHVGRCY